jgi:hypothetical protein
VREEEALRQVLCRHARANADTLAGMSPREIHATLKKTVEADLAAGRFRLSPEAPTPLPWALRNALHLVGVPLLLLLASPLLAVAAVPLAFRLRRLENSDPEVCPRPDPKAVAVLAGQEDHDVTNQFSAMGSLKPGLVRLAVAKLVLLLIDYTARHVYTRGRLARVRSIHFARWVFINDRQRIVFLSSYDGSHESYMDDFVNKVGFGLNVVFSNGIGYPRTRWLLKDGGHHERKFKNWQRRHQIPTQVFYKAYPGLTAVDLERNVRIREGFDARALGEREAREWVALL